MSLAPWEDLMKNDRDADALGAWEPLPEEAGTMLRELARRVLQRRGLWESGVLGP